MRVLIADDNTIFRLALDRILRAGGYEPIEAADGKSALRILRTQPLSLALIDYWMPDMNGIEVCSQLNTLDRFVYAIMLTAEDSRETIAKALEAGASDYLIKPFEEDMLLARLRVGQRIAQIHVQLGQLQKLESLGQLSAGIAHEINTPLQYVGDNARFLEEAIAPLASLYKAYARLVEVAASGPIGQDVLRDIQSSVQVADIEYYLEEIPSALRQSLDGIERVTKIVRAMKEFSHPGGDKASAVDLNRCIESTITVARNEWKYVADVVTDLAADLPLVTCYPGEMNQVFLNILVNAAHAIAAVPRSPDAPKGTIHVSSRLYGEQVEVRIRDSGIGIPLEIRHRIFDPFFTTKDVGKGTGQGLSLAHSVVVRKHGGTLTFETEPGRGTEFIIRVPVTVRDANQLDKAA